MTGRRWSTWRTVRTDDLEEMDVFVQAAKGEEIVAIVDPPRTGLPEKAIRSERRLEH